MLFKWTPNFVPNKIFIFGCGGTGSRVVPLVAQFIKSCPWVINPELHLFDFDEVEVKNLLRQNFIQADVGKNKAVILASRYSKAFNISIIPHVYKFTNNPSSGSERDLHKEISTLLYTNGGSNTLTILCVDTPEARREIVSCLLPLLIGYNNLIIDSGNENDFGQITLSSTIGMSRGSDVERLRDDTPITCDIPFIPLDSEYYDTMIATSTPSCADLDQTMAINTLMAVNIFSIVQNIYYVKPLTFFRINISLQHGASPQYMNTKYFSRLEYTPPGPVSTNMQENSLKHQMQMAYGDQIRFDEEMRKLKDVTTIPEKSNGTAEVLNGDKNIKKTKKKKSPIDSVLEAPESSEHVSEMTVSQVSGLSQQGSPTIVLERALWVDAASSVGAADTVAMATGRLL